jgi:hypothetical protein
MRLPCFKTINATSRLALAVAGGLVATSAFADIKLNDNVSVSGYAVGSYAYTDTSGGTSTDSFDLDAAKVSLLINYDPVSADFGVYYTETSNGENNLTLIDANVTYKVADGLTITGGRFLSWMGYEAFDPINKSQVSSAYINPSGTIMFYPAYHEGLKIKYSTPEITVGAALLDSLYGPSIFRGDGELKSNFGSEVFAAFTPAKGLTIWTGIGYDSAGKAAYQVNSDTVYNIWVQQVFGDFTIAGEYLYNKSSTPGTGSDGLVFVGYNFTPTVSAAFRVSAGKLDDYMGTDGLGFTKYTVSPSFIIAPHLKIRPEISYIKYSNNGPISHDTFFAVQALFQF